MIRNYGLSNATTGSLPSAPAGTTPGATQNSPGQVVVGKYAVESASISPLTWLLIGAAVLGVGAWAHSTKRKH